MKLPLHLFAALVAFVSTGRATEVSMSGTRWLINGKLTNPGIPAEGMLMNVRMVNATFEDRHRPDFDAEANTAKFIAKIPDYAAHGVNAFTLCLQGGMPGYEGAVNAAFEPEGSLRADYLRRVERVIRACDQNGVVVILGFYYQRRAKILREEAAVRAGVVNGAKWMTSAGFKNVVVEVANEFPHKGLAHEIIRSAKGQASLLRFAKQTSPGLLVTASGYGDGKVHPSHGLGMPARNLARIGYCMLQGGRWGAAQVIPKWFVEETAAPTHDVKTPELRWKLNSQVFAHAWELPARHDSASGRSGEGIPADARSKPGSGGQLLAFVPSLDLVIARQTGGSGEWQFEEFLRRALPSSR